MKKHDTAAATLGDSVEPEAALPQIDYKIDRALQIGRTLLETRSTLNQLSKIFGVSASTVSRSIRSLESINYDIWLQCRTIIEYHMCVAHLRGGEANKIRLRRKYPRLIGRRASLDSNTQAKP